MSNVRAIIMKPIDNVCTVVGIVEPGTEITTDIGGNKISIQVSEKIPFGHKFAIKSIKKGDPVFKYGQIIGLASQDILAGQHVHVHNIESCRGRGDKGALWA